MTDIVEQYNSARLTPAPAQMLKDAIDEIERLRAENKKFYAQAEMNARLLTENASLRAENKKLRKALKPFAYYASQIPEDVSNTASASGTVGDLRAAAAALRESE